MVPDTECLYSFHAQNFHRVAKNLQNAEKTWRPTAAARLENGLGLRPGENFLKARIVSQRIPLPAQSQLRLAHACFG